MIKEWVGLSEPETVIDLSPGNDVRRIHCGNPDRQWKLKRSVDPKTRLPSFCWTKHQ